MSGNTTWATMSEDARQTADPVLAALAHVRDNAQGLRQTPWWAASADENRAAADYNRGVDAVLATLNAAITIRKAFMPTPTPERPS